MATVLLSLAVDILCEIWMRSLLDTLLILSVHSASPVLLTSNGPHGTILVFFDFPFFSTTTTTWWPNINLIPYHERANNNIFCNNIYYKYTKDWICLLCSLRIGWEVLDYPRTASNTLLYDTEILKQRNELQLSWGKLQKKPATRWFDESFAPMPCSNEQFAR